jgi:hypothetical protein
MAIPRSDSDEARQSRSEQERLRIMTRYDDAEVEVVK